MEKFLVPFLFLFLICPLVRAEDVQVNASFDKRSVRVGEEIHLDIRISGAQGNIQAPRLPSYKAFDTFYTGRASHISFINGQTSSLVQFSYVLVPKERGKFTLDPIEVFVGSQRYRTDPAEIEVHDDLSGFSPSGQPTSPSMGTPQPAAPTPYSAPQAPPMPSQPQNASSFPPAGPQQAPPAFQPNDDNIFVQAWTDKTTVYPNEQILLTYSLYTRYDTRYEGFEQEPQVSGFWIEDFPMDREVQRETTRLNGKRYVKADLRKIALFPTTAADYTIQPGTLKASIRQEPENTSMFDDFFNDSFFSGGGFFARREDRLLKPPPIAVKVIPFPDQGKPESFQGAVGNFRLSATIDKDTLKQNEPVTMKMVIEGQGNIETLNKPKIPELAGFKIYDSDTSSQLYKTENVIAGRKTFEVVFIPTEAGGKKIPQLEFSFFNPALKTYEKLHTPQFNLHVNPSTDAFKLPENLSQQDVLKKEVELESKDIRFIHERLPGSNQLGDRLYRGFLIADLFLTVLFLFGLFRQREEQIFARNSALKRRRVARSAAESRIRRLKVFSKSEDMSAYFEEVEKILTQYLSDKLNLSAYGITREDLERQLQETLGEKDPLFQEILSLYHLCDESRFGKADIPQEHKAKALKILRDTISRMERLR